MENSGKPVIQTRSLTKKYRLGQEIVVAVNEVNLTIPRGKFVCIMGVSGSGKSTLLHLLAGLDRPTKGEVDFEGYNLSAMSENQMAAFRRKYMGFIFQTYNLIPALSALENVALPLLFAGVPQKERDKRARELLVQLGLGDRLKNRPSQLSGGQQQRVAIARALINHPRVVFADEPTGNLDSHTSKEVMELLTRLVYERGHTLVMVTHDPNVASYADFVFHMRDGQILNGG
ncbi:MAG TPA: ABC transporter ATP-binding protein [Firmicutes bacterium]|nr:ABC transporter ATP-binding protein [Bacillota bacterium]